MPARGYGKELGSILIYLFRDSCDSHNYIRHWIDLVVVLQRKIWHYDWISFHKVIGHQINLISHRLNVGLND